MVNVIGENNVQFKTIRPHGGAVADHSQSLDADQRNHAGAQLCEGPPKPPARLRGSSSVVGHVEALPPAVTAAERAEERLGVLMLREALNDPLIPNPPKWRAATAFAQARREQLVKERRERVKAYAQVGKLTTVQVAERENVVQTTIRDDCRIMNVRLRPSVIKQTQYQEDIAARRERLTEMAVTGMTRQAASVELGVSESTVRRDIRIMRIIWAGK